MTKAEEKESTSTVLSVRFSAEELDELRHRAERAGVPVSSFVRRYALERQVAAPGSVMTVLPNRSTTVDATTSIEVVAYSGSYAKTVGRNS